MLLLSAGAPMFVMGDEFARTQGGHDNPYNIDSELTWVDWDRLAAWSELHGHVQQLLRFRRANPPAELRFYGVGPVTDTSFESRSLAWAYGDLYVMANMRWEPQRFEFQEPGPWLEALSTAAPDGTTLPPRSIVIWRREQLSSRLVE